jgi:YjbE family integral membrane protein
MAYVSPLLVLLQVIAIDVSLAGDNAIAVGMAAAGLSTKKRHRAVYGGIAIAAFLRILFAIFAVKLLHITGLLAGGGLLLLWIAWRMYCEIRLRAPLFGSHMASVAEPHAEKKLSRAVLQIAIADISMSLDNVVAVAGAARDHLFALVFGLALSVLLVGTAATWVARITSRRGWIAWTGLVIVIFTALQMIVEGGQEIWRAVG